MFSHGPVKSFFQDMLTVPMLSGLVRRALHSRALNSWVATPAEFSPGDPEMLAVEGATRSKPKMTVAQEMVEGSVSTELFVY
jgi:hypothetical protein